jgi:F0F1-type ATP synthase membrane subunit b/b'
MNLFLIYLITNVAQASSDGGHHAGPSSLIAPAFNLAFLLVGLIYLTKKKISDHFQEKSKEISDTLERANLKSKEAQVLLENQERKMNHLSQEIKNIQQKTDAEVKTFEQNYQLEITQKTSKLKSDAILKIEADKRAMNRELNAKVLDQVIKKTKEKIKTDRDLQAKATSKLLQDIK